MNISYCIWACLSLLANRYIPYKGHGVLNKIDHYSHLGKANIFFKVTPYIQLTVPICPAPLHAVPAYQCRSCTLFYEWNI